MHSTTHYGQVGRQLAAQGLLKPLKARYAGLFHFLQQRSQARK